MIEAGRKNQVHQLFWKLLSLWAILALSVPSLAWACPMNGSFSRTATALCPCSKMAAQSTPAITPDSADTGDGADSSDSHHACCKQLPLPSSDTSGDHKNGAPFVSKISSLRYDNASVTSTPDAFAPYAVLPTLQALSLELRTLPTPSTSPPRIISQHTARQNSGRSPPF